MGKLAYFLGYKKLNANTIIEILELAKEQAERDGYDLWPTTLWTSQEIDYIQQTLDGAE